MFSERNRAMDIDLVKTYQKYAHQNGAVKAPKISPFHKTIYKYSSIIKRCNDQNLYSGLKLALVYEIKQFYWWHEVIGIPLFRSSLYHLENDPFARAEKIADSTILSVLLYKVELKESVSGLASAVRSDMSHGLLLICDWVCKGASIEEGKNPYIEALPSTIQDAISV